MCPLPPFRGGGHAGGGSRPRFEPGMGETTSAPCRPQPTGHARRSRHNARDQGLRSPGGRSAAERGGCAGRRRRAALHVFATGPHGAVTRRAKRRTRTRLGGERCAAEGCGLQTLCVADGSESGSRTAADAPSAAGRQYRAGSGRLHGFRQPPWGEPLRSGATLGPLRAGGVLPETRSA